MNSAHHLAQLNIATMKEPADSPTMADFVADIARINALADSAPGFVWRLTEARRQLSLLRQQGPSAAAFTFSSCFDPG